MALRFLLCLTLFLLLVSCSGPAAPDPAARPGPVSESAESASREMLVPLTHEASELRRIRDEHAALIRSIPPTPEATPTLTPAERSLVAMARVRRHPEGVPVPPRVGEDWFNPELGLEFYRDSGGDWTPRRVRESHPHRDLLYFSNYPESVPNFTAGSIDDHLARELVFEAVAVLPLLGEPTPAMVGAFSRRLGWELRDSPEPVVNLWATFVVQRGGLSQVYAVGGVMRLGVSSTGEGEELMEYVTPGPWLGPVVVERLR